MPIICELHVRSFLMSRVSIFGCVYITELSMRKKKMVKYKQHRIKPLEFASELKYFFLCILSTAELFW